MPIACLSMDAGKNGRVRYLFTRLPAYEDTLVTVVFILMRF